MTDPADLVQEACDLLAALYPLLAHETPDPDCSAFAAPGMTARPSAAPVPGNAAVMTTPETRTHNAAQLAVSTPPRVRPHPGILR